MTTKCFAEQLNNSQNAFSDLVSLNLYNCMMWVLLFNKWGDFLKEAM